MGLTFDVGPDGWKREFLQRKSNLSLCGGGLEGNPRAVTAESRIIKGWLDAKNTISEYDI